MLSLLMIKKIFALSKKNPNLFRLHIAMNVSVSHIAENTYK